MGTGPKAGTHTLVVTGNDPDSGVRDVELRIDGHPVGSASFAGSCSPVRWQVCPANPSHSFTVDTTALTDGSHAVSAVVSDHAGNTRTADWGDIVVRNSRVGGTDPIDDFDGDGRPNGDDADDDNDGVLDGADPDPFNPNIPGPDNGGSAPGGSTTVIIERPSTPAKETAKPADTAKPAETNPTVPAGPVVAAAAPTNGAGASERAVVTLYGSPRSRPGRWAMAPGRHDRPRHGRVRPADLRRGPHRRGAGLRPEGRPPSRASWVPVVPAEPLVTGKDGSFRYIVPAGHSRTVRVGYKARVPTRSRRDAGSHRPGRRQGDAGTSRKELRNGQRVTSTGASSAAASRAAA